MLNLYNELRLISKLNLAQINLAQINLAQINLAQINLAQINLAQTLLNQKHFLSYNEFSNNLDSSYDLLINSEHVYILKHFLTNDQKPLLPKIIKRNKPFYKHLIGQYDSQTNKLFGYHLTVL
jgi:hypothetical protein